jgi:predicted permease
MDPQAALANQHQEGPALYQPSQDRERQHDLGLQPDRVLAVSLRWPAMPPTATEAERAREEQRREHAALAMLERIAAAPDVERAAVAVGTPFGGAYAIGLRLPGRDSLPRLSGGFGDPDVSAVSADYFATMGTRLERGRAFTPADRAGSEPVAIVSATMARVLWPGADALGQCLLVNGAAACTRVVGVVQDARRSRIREDPLMHYYLPLGQQTALSGPELLVRPRGDAEAAIPALRALVRRLDPSITFVDAQTVQERVEPQTRSWRIGAMMFSLFAGLALVVATVGTFSVVAYVVEQRRHELGVRLALGARGGHVVALMLRGAVGATALGVLLGGAAALLAGRFAEPLLFETSARDPLVLGGVAAVLVLASGVASVIPALRARRVDPIGALRSE